MIQTEWRSVVVHTLEAYQALLMLVRADAQLAYFKRIGALPAERQRVMVETEPSLQGLVLPWLVRARLNKYDQAEDKLCLLSIVFSQADVAMLARPRG